MNNILSPELIEKLNTKLNGLLDLVNTTNIEQLFKLIVKYNITSYTSTIVLCICLIIICVIAMIIAYRKLCSDNYCVEGFWIAVMIIGFIVICFALMIAIGSGYDLFLWTTNPEISVIKWLK